MPRSASRRLAPGAPIAALLALLSLAACGGRHHLSDYTFTSRSMALVFVAPPAPELQTGRIGLAQASNPVDAALRAGSGVAKEVEGRRARVRLDSATSRVDVRARLAQRTLERASRYLGTRPVANADSADFLLEVDMRSFGIDARGESAAYLFMNAETVLLDARTGREIWNLKVRGRDRLTPFVRGGDHVPAGIITAGALSTVSVEEFQRVLEQLSDYSSDLITDELRAALRDVRKR
jgi:hypothetical protein